MYSAGPESSLWRSQKSNNLLLKGAANGDVEIVKRAISEGADINVHDSFNNFQRTPLHWAAFKGHLNVMSEVITRGADIESTNDDKSTPLHLAAAYDHPEACKFLVCSGANPNAVDVFGRTPLHRAAVRGHTRIASYLISQGAHVNAINNKGDTPLHDACYAGDVNFVDLLLSKGADPSIRNNRGRLSVDNVSYNRDAILQLVRNKQTLSQGYGSPPPILSTILGVNVQPSTPQDSHQNRRVQHLLQAKKSQPLLPDREVQVEAKKSQSLLHNREVWGLTQQLQGLQPPTLQQDLQEDLKSRDIEILDLTHKLEAINDQVQEKDRQIQDLTLQKDREIQHLTQQLKISHAIVQATNALQQELQKKDNEIQRLTQELHVTNSQVQDKEREMQRRDIDYNLQLQEATTALQQAQQNIQQLQEATIQRRQGQEDSHWVVNRDEIHMTEQVIGRGAYGEVKVAHFRGLKVAAKHMHQIILSPYYSAIFAREMKMAACVRHPNLLQFIGAVQEGVPVILTEWMSTSLRKELEKSPLTRPQIIKICTDITLALNYLHLWKPHPILHRDVSSQNVLLECSGTGARQWKAKLSDYGLANFTHQISVNSGPGCPAYSAPEAPYPDHHSPAMDVYSFGILLIEMILCQPPPPTTAEKERLVLLIRWQSLQHLVQRCIVNDPRSRLTCAQILTELDNL